MARYFKGLFPMVGKGFRSKSNKFRLFLIIMLSLVTSGLNLLAPFLLTIGFHDLIEEYDKHEKEEKNIHIYLYIVGFGVLWMLSRIFSNVRVMLVSQPTVDLASELTQDITRTYYQRPMQYRVSSSMAREVEFFSNIFEHVADNFVKVSLSSVLPSTIEVLSATAVLSYEDQYVGLFLAGMTFIYCMTTLLFSGKIGVAQNYANGKAHKVFKSLVQRISQYEAAHYNSSIDYEIKQLSKSLRDFKSAYTNSEHCRESVNLIQALIIGIGYSLMIYLGVKNTNYNEYPPAHLIWIIMYVSQFSVSLNDLAKSVSQLSQSYTKYKELYDYLHEKHEFSNDDSTPIALVVDRKTAKIKFSNVSLSYPDKELALAGVM